MEFPLIQSPVSMAAVFDGIHGSLDHGDAHGRRSSRWKRARFNSSFLRIQEQDKRWRKREERREKKNNGILFSVCNVRFFSLILCLLFFFFFFLVIVIR